MGFCDRPLSWPAMRGWRMAVSLATQPACPLPTISLTSYEMPQSLKLSLLPAKSVGIPRFQREQGSPVCHPHVNHEDRSSDSAVSPVFHVSKLPSPPTVPSQPLPRMESWKEQNFGIRSFAYEPYLWHVLAG